MGAPTNKAGGVVYWGWSANAFSRYYSAWVAVNAASCRVAISRAQKRGELYARKNNSIALLAPLHAYTIIHNMSLNIAHIYINYKYTKCYYNFGAVT